MVCDEAEKIRRNVGHHCRSFSVSSRSAGSGSIAGRGAGLYGACGWAAQAVNASAHAALSSFEVRGIVLLLFECIGVPGVQLRAQVRLGFSVALSLGLAQLFAGGDRRGMAGFVSLGAVVLQTEPAAGRQPNQDQHGDQQALDRAHFAPGVSWS